MPTRRFARSRWPAYVVGVGVVLAAGAPAFSSNPAVDSYPLSTYPMFARPIAKPQLFLAESVDEKRRVRRISPKLVANDEVMQSFKTIRSAVVGGEPALARLCETIARRVGKSDAHKKAVKVRIVAARFDPVAYFVDESEPDDEQVLFTCKVPRRK